ncbi:hypothetical protein TNCV_447231 [Trichonephila clavipes]|nr:hypothetical protein TNCV_447231 [Trichonephila clavipes]
MRRGELTLRLRKAASDWSKMRRVEAFYTTLTRNERSESKLCMDLIRGAKSKSCREGLINAKWPRNFIRALAIVRKSIPVALSTCRSHCESTPLL